MQNLNICIADRDPESIKGELAEGLQTIEAGLCDKKIFLNGISVDLTDSEAETIIRKALEPCMQCQITDRYECDDFRDLQAILLMVTGS